MNGAFLTIDIIARTPQIVQANAEPKKAKPQVWRQKFCCLSFAHPPIACYLTDPQTREVRRMISLQIYARQIIRWLIETRTRLTLEPRGKPSS